MQNIWENLFLLESEESTIKTSGLNRNKKLKRKEASGSTQRKTFLCFREINSSDIRTFFSLVIKYIVNLCLSIHERKILLTDSNPISEKKETSVWRM